MRTLNSKRMGACTGLLLGLSFSVSQALGQPGPAPAEFAVPSNSQAPSAPSAAGTSEDPPSAAPIEGPASSSPPVASVPLLTDDTAFSSSRALGGRGFDSPVVGHLPFSVPNLTAGSPYTVRLDFAEVWWNAAGQRLFNVTINGTQVLSNFDIFAAAGGQNIAIAEQFGTTANSSGQIVITFTTVKDNAKVSGIEIIAGAPELLAGTALVNSPAPSLTQQQLDRVVARAIQLWTATGLNAYQVAALQHAQFVIAPLPDGMLGDTVGNVIYIDANADGYGWSTGAAVAPNQVDLLTVVAHELGHELGLPDVATQTHPGNVMDDTLAPGMRRLPRSGAANIRWNW